MPRLLACLLLSPCLLAQNLTISVEGEKSFTVTAAEISRMDHIPANYFEAGRTTEYRGVPVEVLLKKAGAPLNAPHGGKTMHLAVLATANDGYQVVYALAEFDSAVVHALPIVADETGGKPLAEKIGPLRLIMPEEKKGARSIRMLEKLEVIDLTTRQPAAH